MIGDAVPLEAVSHLADIGTGDTRPQIFLYDSGGEQQRWALNLMGLSSGELAVELIGSLLALRLGLPNPHPEDGSLIVLDFGKSLTLCLQ